MIRQCARPHVPVRTWNTVSWLAALSFGACRGLGRVDLEGFRKMIQDGDWTLERSLPLGPLF